LGQFQRVRFGFHTAATEAGVQFDEYADGTSACSDSRRDSAGSFRRVKRHSDLRALGEARQPSCLDWSNNRIRDQKIVKAGVDHYLGLVEFGHRDAAGAILDLLACELGDLVGLRVWAETKIMAAAIFRHPGQIGLHDVQIDDERGRVEFGYQHQGTIVKGASCLTDLRVTMSLISMAAV
jgi:hypothetical protein